MINENIFFSLSICLSDVCSSICLSDSFRKLRRGGRWSNDRASPLMKTDMLSNFPHDLILEFGEVVDLEDSIFPSVGDGQKILLHFRIFSGVLPFRLDADRENIGA